MLTMSISRISKGCLDWIGSSSRGGDVRGDVRGVVNWQILQRAVGALVVQDFRAVELMEGLVDYGCGDEQLLDIFNLAIQELIFDEENRWMFGDVVRVEGGDDF
uniref:Uncharacterized protein n=1 Tax=Romanomermis culicivorax TaxID=13658 RepID=A0A915HM31_ROMCU